MLTQVLCVTDVHPSEETLKDWIAIADSKIAEAAKTLEKLKKLTAVSSKIYSTSSDEGIVPEILNSSLEQKMYKVVRTVD